MASTEEKQSHCSRRHCYGVWRPFSVSMLGLLHMCEWVGCPDLPDMPGNHLRAFWSPWRRRGSWRNVEHQIPELAWKEGLICIRFDVGRFNDLKLIRSPMNLSSILSIHLLHSFWCCSHCHRWWLLLWRHRLWHWNPFHRRINRKNGFALTPQSFVCVCVHVQPWRHCILYI